MGEVLGGIPTIIMGGLTSLLNGLGSAVVDFFQTLFLTNTGTTSSPVWQLSTFAYVTFVLMGVGMAIGISVLIFNIVRKRKIG